MATAAGGKLLAAEAAHARDAEAAEMRRIAEQIAEEHPLWIVMFGDFTKQFVAFPRFPVPRGTVIAVSYPGAVPGRMRAIEERALPGLAEGMPLPGGQANDVPGR
jgi:hypothetical protein